MASTRVPLIKTESDSLDMASKLEMSTAEIGLTVRATNLLEERGIFTVADLLGCTRKDVGYFQFRRKEHWRKVSKALEGVGFCRRSKQAAVKKASSPSRPR